MPPFIKQKVESSFPLLLPNESSIAFPHGKGEVSVYMRKKFINEKNSLMEKIK
jgi:hypothetical protein